MLVILIKVTDLCSSLTLGGNWISTTDMIKTLYLSTCELMIAVKQQYLITMPFCV